jgi:hypothetical protein
VFAVCFDFVHVVGMRGAVTLVVVAGMVAAVACGSSESPADGDSGTACATLIGQYAAALVIAQSCDPGASIPSCSVSVADGLECACQTFVTNDAQLLANLDEIQQSWLAKDCDAAVNCSALGACQAPTGATCQAGPQDPSTGYCTDSF